MRCCTIIFFLSATVPGIYGGPAQQCFVNFNGERKPVPMNKNEICCNGVKEPKDTLNGKDCCRGRNPDDDQFYYKTQSICCNGTVQARFVTDRNSPTEMACCKKLLVFNKGTHLCCGGELRSLSEMDNSECCGRELIDSNTHLCCRDEDNATLVSIIQKREGLKCCGHHVFDENLKQCSSYRGMPTVIYRQQKLCGGTKIELTEKTCCYGMISNTPYLDPTNPRELNPHSACCGQTGYDPRTHNCCSPYELKEGVVIQKLGHLQCCGSGSMDTQTQVCCNDKAVYRNGPADTCCGTEVINPSTQGCCDGKPFYNRTHYCCEGFPSQPLKTGLKCCGGREMKDYQLCCEDYEPVDKISLEDDKCCLKEDYTFVPYYSRNKDCTDMRLVTRLGPNDDDCFGSRYLPDKAVCCGYKVHEFPPGQTLACCIDYEYKQTAYNINTQMCCRGMFYNLSQAEYECCGNLAFEKYEPGNPCRQCDPTQMTDPHMICCGGQQYLKSIYGDSCCGRKPYSQTRSTCCNDKLFDSSGVKCCGTEAYSSQRSTCCDDDKLVHKPRACPSQGTMDSQTASGSRLRLSTISVMVTAVFSLAAS